MKSASIGRERRAGGNRAAELADSAMMPAVRKDSDHSHQALWGIGLKLVSVLFLAAMAACVKGLAGSVPPGQIVFSRGVISLMVVALVAWRTEGLHILRTGNWRAHAARSIAGSLSMFCWFLALAMIPLARMTAISFTIPLFLTVFAMLFLREKIRWYRWTALAIGFSGVLIMVAPGVLGGSGNVAGSAVALLAAVLAALALMFLRRMSNEEHALAITFYFFLTSSTLALLTVVTGGWTIPNPTQWLLLLLVGIFGVLGQLTMTYCYRYAEASLVAPIDYVSLLFSVAIGYYAFSEIPHVSTWIGAPLVVAAGGIILWREYNMLRRGRSSVETGL